MNEINQNSSVVPALSDEKLALAALFAVGLTGSNLPSKAVSYLYDSTICRDVLQSYIKNFDICPLIPNELVRTDFAKVRKVYGQVMNRLLVEQLKPVDKCRIDWCKAEHGNFLEMIRTQTIDSLDLSAEIELIKNLDFIAFFKRVKKKIPAAQRPDLSDCQDSAVKASKIAEWMDHNEELLKEIKRLDLRNLDLMFLSPKIELLTGLKWLDLTNNQLQSLPESMGMLSELEYVDLSENQLESLPESIGDLINLEVLVLNSNKLKSLPESIGKLERLNDFWCRDNLLEKLPEEIGGLKNLLNFDLGCNQLKNLPKSIGGMKQLQILNLEDNQFESWPEGIEAKVFLDGNLLFGSSKRVAGDSSDENSSDGDTIEKRSRIEDAPTEIDE
jgi:hypothetical protein